MDDDELRQALSPVIDWFQSDEEPPRPLIDIVHDVVAELVSDRADNIRLRAAIRPLIAAYNADTREPKT